MKLDAVSERTDLDRKEWRASALQLREFAASVLIAAQTDSEAAWSVATALTETSLRGVDSHGIRLLLHYARVVQTGRINPRPRLSFRQTSPGSGIVNADHGFGHHASYFAIDHAVRLAQANGIAAVSVVDSSHFGSAGCYVLRAAEKGLLAIAVCNSDSFVLPHDGIRPFNGTNPIAFAAPVPASRPLLVDMATSVIPWNRVQDLMNEGLPLPPDVAVDRHGEVTTDPAASAALLPLGGTHYGYKGAALASMVEVLTSVLTGMPHCSRLQAMAGPDFTTHRRLGHFFIVINPASYVSSELYAAGMLGYLGDLRAQPAKAGMKVLAPGDREWSVTDERTRYGIPVASQLKADLDALADRFKISRIAYAAA